MGGKDTTHHCPTERFLCLQGCQVRCCHHSHKCVSIFKVSFTLPSFTPPWSISSFIQSASRTQLN